MVRRLITEMELLALDSDEDATYLSSRYDYMTVVGTNDLYEGLQVGPALSVTGGLACYVLTSSLKILQTAPSQVHVRHVCFAAAGRSQGIYGLQHQPI